MRRGRLNYIPFLGPLIATVFPTLFAVAQFEAWQPVVLIFLCLNFIQFIIGSYLEPLLAGASLKISPTAVIFSIFFWTFVWGLAGPFIAVPILIVLIVLIVYFSQFPTTGWISTLLSDGSGAHAANGQPYSAKETSNQPESVEKIDRAAELK